MIVATAMPSGSAQEPLLDAGPAAGDEFEGAVTVVHQRWCSDDGQFAVVVVELESGEELVAVGPLGHLEQDSRARLVGTFELHHKHGLQLDAREAEPLDPDGIDGIRRYLKTIPGIGGKRADELIDRHGAAVFEAIDRDPEATFRSIRGVSDATAAEAAEEWANRRAERRLYALLAPHGLARHVAELIAIHGVHAVEEVRDDPYSLTEIAGIGFLGADRVALATGTAPDSQRRMRAAAVHALREAESQGHTHLPRGELIDATRELLGGAEPSMAELRAAPELHVEEAETLSRDDPRIYRGWTFAAEQWLAARFAAMSRGEPAWSKPPTDGELAGYELTDQQREAVTVVRVRLRQQPLPQHPGEEGRVRLRQRRNRGDDGVPARDEVQDRRQRLPPAQERQGQVQEQGRGLRLHGRQEVLQLVLSDGGRRGRPAPPSLERPPLGGR